MNPAEQIKLHTEFHCFIIITSNRWLLSLLVDRLLYGTTKGQKDMVHREQDDYNRQGQSLHTHAQTHMSLPP